MTRIATRQRDGRIVPAYMAIITRQRASVSNADWQARPRQQGLLQRIFGRVM